MQISKTDKTFGLPKAFWNWYHRQEKQPGDPDIDIKEVRPIFEEWIRLGRPGPERK
jgi:hypothetical protein